MTATAGGLLLLCIVILFFLHLLWRLGTSRSGSALACFAAAYLILVALLRQQVDTALVSPLLLPFVYAYAWLGVTAVMWAAAHMRVDGRVLSFPGQDRRLAALLCSQLALHIGVLGLSPWLSQQPRAIYLLAPPLTIIVSYLAYRLQLLAMRRQPVCGTSWISWGALCLMIPLLMTWLKDWAVPLLLHMT
ncbi:hypothetical protein C2134_18835 [Chromobacterium sinusclupearum]|uniref:Uncharacterized protein n=1 Tax=Chromobacterium sinusclupearum TaxID=2077146 RepID=A0A2K4MIW2_9NEIS|nr:MULTISPECIES: hypothetical protein [Chromobacterium]POA97010.1 hypothetical protein C2134_18835 [Chromobacterium sinusclupearum]